MIDDRLQVLLDELKHMRAARGMTQEDLAKAINYSPSTVAMVETAGRKPPQGFWPLVDKALDTGGSFVRLVIRLGSPQWMREWASAEADASALRWYELSVLPGLLQTEAYARALLSSGAILTLEEVDRHVAARL